VRKDITVAADVRTTRGKNEARRTRVAGQIPAVLYGAFKDAVSVSVNPREIQKIIRSATGYNTIFTLAIAGGETTPVMVVPRPPAARRSETHRSYQAHPHYGARACRGRARRRQAARRIARSHHPRD
jgi:large subunit ribosomal protein L25